MTYYLKIKKIQNQSQIFPQEDAVTTDRNDKIPTRKKNMWKTEALNENKSP